MSELDSVSEDYRHRKSEFDGRLDRWEKRGNSRDRRELFKWLCKNLLSSQANWDDAERTIETLDKDDRLWTLDAGQMADALWNSGYASRKEKTDKRESKKGRDDRARKGKWLVTAREKFLGTDEPEAILVWMDRLRDDCAQSPVEARNKLADRQQPDHVDGMGMKVASHFLRGLGFSHNELAILDYWILKCLVRNNVITQTEADAVAQDRRTYLSVEPKMKRWAQAASDGPPFDVLDLLLWRRPS